jgi:Protein of unknown function (DUF3352)
MVRIRFTIPALAITAALAFAGCGSSSGSSESASPASLAEPGSVVFVEGNIKPKGELASNVNSVAKTLAGIDDLGDFVVSEIESSGRNDGEPVDFAKEVEPWLGERAGVAFDHLEGDELSEPLIAVQATNPEAAQAFVEKQASDSSEPGKKGSFEGVDFEVGGPEDNAIGVVGEWLVIADNENEFKQAVTASDGDSLAGEDRFQNAIEAASDGSLADVYIDVGALIKQSGDNIDSQAREVLQSAGIDPSEATAVASIIPGADEITVDLSSELAGEKAPSGDVSKLLGTMPASSDAAFAVTGFGEQLEEAIDSIDESGIPPELPPGQLKSTLSQAGIDLNKIAASLEDAAVFVEGNNRSSLGGAAVVSASGSEAAEAVAALGLLLRGAKVPGISAVSGKASGFSVRSEDLGGKPIVVIAEGDRLAIGYGLAGALRGLSGGGATLSGNPAYKAAVSSLGQTPISAFANGPAALELAEALVPRSKTDFWEARPYLKKIAYLALGSGSSDELATAKLIAGLQK